MTDRTREGVELPAGVAGSRLLFEQLRRVADGAEGAYAEALPADSRAFRKDYGEALARFEAVRAGRPDRTAHAVTLARSGEAALVFAGTDGDCSLAEALAAPADALRLETQRFPGAGGLLPALPLSEPRFGADGVESAVGQLLDEGRLTESAAGAIGWSLDRARTDGGELDLRGEQFAILGAAAELAPTKLLLEAGARVLWIDRVAPPAGLEKESGLSGELCWVGDGADLLTQPAEISQTVAAFAGDSPVHLGLYAYAPGAAREWRLAVAMNAIADATPATVASISMLISPTSPAVLEPEDRQAARARREERPLWQSALDAMARFPEGVYECGELAVPRSLVSIQGTAYQAAQYLAKRLPAEAWLAEGLGGRRIAVSANVAPISHTRSLSHPVFNAAFGGARAFGVDTYPAPITRALMAWLMLHDVLNPDAPGAATASGSAADRARKASGQQVHGGLFGLPYALEPALRYAAVIGFARRPGLLASFLRR